MYAFEKHELRHIRQQVERLNLPWYRRAAANVWLWLLGAIVLASLGCAERDSHGRIVAPNGAMLAASDGMRGYSNGVRQQQTTCYTTRMGTQYVTRCR
jgi:hypothetical protein